MNKRRRKTGSDVNLFAFQDIMASVIGTLFFVVLLMALDIIEGVPKENAAAKEQINALLAQRKQLISEESRAVVSIDDLSTMLALITNPQAAVEKLTSSHGELIILHKRIEAANALHVELQQRLDETDAQLRKEALETEREERENRPHLTYIVDTPRGLTPWVVEVTSEKIRVASATDINSVLEFTGRSQAAMTAQFMKWARTQNRRMYYFCFLAKPSGIEKAKELLDDVKSAGFDIGLDLVPEDWQLY